MLLQPVEPEPSRAEWPPPVVPRAALIDPLICEEWERRLEAISARRWAARWLT